MKRTILSPSMLKKSFLSSGTNMAAIFTAGNFVVTAVGAACGLLYARWIGPEVLGQFSKFGIPTGYMMIGTVFVSEAFSRHFPYYLGKKDEQAAIKIAGAAKWWYLAIVWVGTLVFLALALKSALSNDGISALGWFAQIPVFIVSTYGLYLKTLYRSNKDFLKMNKYMLTKAAVGVLTLPLIYFFKFSGLALRSIIQNITEVSLFAHGVPFKVKATFSLREIFQLSKVSLPLTIPSYLESHAMKASIALVILGRLGEDALGIYGMAIMLQRFLMVFARSFQQIISTKILLHFGYSNSLAKTLRYIARPVLLVSVFALFLSVVFGLCIKPAVVLFIPKYSMAVPILQILAFEMVLNLLMSPFTLFIAALMYKQLITIRIVKAAALFALVLTFGHGLVQIATAVILANVIQAITSYALLGIAIARQGRATP